MPFVLQFLSVILAISATVRPCRSLEPPNSVCRSPPGRLRRCEDGSTQCFPNGLAWVGPLRPSPEELDHLRDMIQENWGYEPPNELKGAVEPELEAPPPPLSSVWLSNVVGLTAENMMTSLREGGKRVVIMIKGGGKWIFNRWQRKLGYCLLGIYVLRFQRRLLKTARASRQETSDVHLDHEDALLEERGSILALEGQALLTRLASLGPPPTTPTTPTTPQAPACSTLPGSNTMVESTCRRETEAAPRVHEVDGGVGALDISVDRSVEMELPCVSSEEEHDLELRQGDEQWSEEREVMGGGAGEGQCGKSLERRVKLALGVRYVRGRREVYSQELAEALLDLEELR
ncbi:unnamed protein product [Choristocarpus tenellus]